jgi:hypothetical protein
MGSDMGGSFGPELGLADYFGGFVWHPASLKYKEEASTLGFSILGLCPRHESFMLTIVPQDNGCAEFQEHRVAKLFSSCYSAASSSELPSSTSRRFKLQKRILLIDKQ